MMISSRFSRRSRIVRILSTLAYITPLLRSYTDAWESAGLRTKAAAAVLARTRASITTVALRESLGDIFSEPITCTHRFVDKQVNKIEHPAPRHNPTFQVPERFEEYDTGGRGFVTDSLQ